MCAVPCACRGYPLAQVDPSWWRASPRSESINLSSAYLHSTSFNVSMPPSPRTPTTTLQPCPVPTQRRHPPWCVVGSLRHGGVKHPKPLKRKGVQVPKSNRRSAVALARTRGAFVTSGARAHAAPSSGIALVRMRRLHATARHDREVGMASRMTAPAPRLLAFMGLFGCRDRP